MAKTQAEICEERNGLTNPAHLEIECECGGCTGTLEVDGHNMDNTLAFLLCTVCGCTYTTAKTPR